MMYRLLSYSFLLTAVLILAGCGKKPSSTLTVIPADSPLVVSVKLGQLSNKMDFNEVKSRTPLGFIGGLLSMQGIPNFIDDRSVTGINFEESVYLFLADTNQLAVAFQLADEAKTREFMASINKDRPMQEGDGYVFTDIGQIAIGWSRQAGLLVMGSDEQDPVDLMDRLFHLPEDSSMAGTDNIASLKRLDRDIALQIDLSLLQDEWDLNASDLSGKMHLSLSFEKGQVEIATLLENSTDNMQAIKSLVQPSINKELLQIIPDDKTPAMIGMRFQTAQIEAVLRQLGVLNLLQASGSDADERMKAWADRLLAACTGELVVALSGMDVTQESYEPVRLQPHWYLAAGISDEVPFRALMDTLQAEGVVTAEDGYWVNTNPELGILVLRDGMLLVSTYPEYYNALVAGGQGTLNSELYDALTDYPLYASVDLQQMANLLVTAMEAADLADQEDVVPVIRQLADVLDKLEIIAMEPTNTGWEGKAVLYLNNTEENSLSVLTISLVGILLNSGMLPI